MIEYASIDRRSLSFIIDDLLVSFLFIAIFFDQITAIASQEAMVLFVTTNSWVLILLKVIYHTFFIAYSGATIGKYVAKIVAIDEKSKEKLSWSMAALRAIIRVIGESLLYVTFLFALFNPKRQTLHDKLTNCVVINVKDR